MISETINDRRHSVAGEHWKSHAPSPDSLMAGANAGLIVSLDRDHKDITQKVHESMNAMSKSNAIVVKFTAIVYFRCLAGGVAPRLGQRRRKSLIS